MSDTSTQTRRPRSLDVAAGALALAAVLGVVAAGVQYVGGYRAWDFRQVQKAYAKSKTAKVHDRTIAQIHSDVSQAFKTYTAFGLLIGALLLFVAYGVYRGKYWARWSAVAIWVLSYLLGSLIGVQSIISVSAGAPVLNQIVGVGGFVVLTVGVIMAAFYRPNVLYLSLTKKPRSAARSGGLFAPKPRPARPTSAPAPARPNLTKSRPATVKAAPVARPKAKARVDVTASAPSSVPSSGPSKAGERPRGKSRKI